MIKTKKENASILPILSAITFSYKQILQEKDDKKALKRLKVIILGQKI